jgi:hypothetical protein
MRHAYFPLAGSRLPPHNVNMGQDHPFTVEIREHLNEERRFGWKIFENGKARDESPMHFSAKREAVTDAQRVMQLARHTLADRQMTKLPRRPRDGC